MNEGWGLAQRGFRAPSGEAKPLELSISQSPPFADNSLLDATK